MDRVLPVSSKEVAIILGAMGYQIFADEVTSLLPCAHECLPSVSCIWGWKVCLFLPGGRISPSSEVQMGQVLVKSGAGRNEHSAGWISWRVLVRVPELEPHDPWENPFVSAVIPPGGRFFKVDLTSLETFDNKKALTPTLCKLLGEQTVKSTFNPHLLSFHDILETVQGTSDANIKGSNNLVGKVKLWTNACSFRRMVHSRRAQRSDWRNALGSWWRYLAWSWSC